MATKTAFNLKTMNADQNYDDGYKHGASDAVKRRQYSVTVDRGTDGIYYSRINGYTLAKHSELERLKFNTGHILNGFHIRLGLPELTMNQLQFELIS